MDRIEKEMVDSDIGFSVYDQADQMMEMVKTTGRDSKPLKILGNDGISARK